MTTPDREGPSPAPAPSLAEDARLGEFLDALVALAAGDTSRRVAVLGDGSLLDGIGTGLNMMADELAGREARERLGQQRLLHSERLAAVGRLAAGVAHEINNPAASLLANLTSLRAQVEALDGRGGAAPAALLEELRAVLDDGLAGVRRIATTVRALLDHAHLQTSALDETRLDVVAAEAARLVAREVTARARLVTRLAPVPPVEADASLLVQVATNLLLNAAQAVPEGEPERHEVEIVTAAVEGGVVLQVRDTGTGIPEALQASIFEPFFTTKPRGVGTGLGLWLSSEVVRGHGGEIRVRSSPGRGTTFEVWLPTRPAVRAARTAPPPAPTPAPPADAAAAPPRPAGRADRRRLKVLLVDDEPTLLAAYRRMLGDGFAVTVAAGGRQALEAIEADPDWDAVLCDVLMPGVDGPAVHAHLEAHHPALARRLAFCTAGAFTPRSVAFTDSMRGRVHAKPLEKEQLEALLRQLAER